MVRVLAFLFSLWSGAAFAQGSFVTIVSPSTLTVSETAGALPVTATGSPATVVCLAGCGSAGASPSTVVISAGNITNTVNTSLTGAVSLWGNTSVTQVTSPWEVNGQVSVGGTVSISPATGTSAFSVTATGSPATIVCAAGCGSAGASPSTVVVSAGNITNTVTTSLNNSVTIAGTPTVSVGGTALVSLSAPTSLWGNVGIGQTVLISPAVGTSAFSVTATGSPATVVISAGNITNTVTTSLNNSITIAGTPTVSIAGTALISNAGTAPVSLNATSQVSLATVLVSIPVQQIVSQVAIFPTAEQNGSAWPNRANFFAGSLTATSAAAQTVVNAPPSGRLYVTFLGCGRLDSATSVMTAAFNISASAGGKYTLVVPPSSSANMNLSFTTPLSLAATQPLQVTLSTTPATQGVQCNANGYVAP